MLSVCISRTVPLVHSRVISTWLDPPGDRSGLAVLMVIGNLVSVEMFMMIENALLTMSKIYPFTIQKLTVIDRVCISIHCSNASRTCDSDCVTGHRVRTFNCKETQNLKDIMTAITSYITWYQYFK